LKRNVTNCGSAWRIALMTVRASAAPGRCIPVRKESYLSEQELP
jgi:hypothetical protein